MKAARDVGEQQKNLETAPGATGERSTRGSKRKRPSVEGVEQSEERPAQRTRSQRKAATSSRRTPNYQGQVDGASGMQYAENGRNAEDPTMLDSDDPEAEYTPTPTPETRHSNEGRPDDGLVACPICNQRMKHELVFQHLDTCTSNSNATTAAPSRLAASNRTSTPPTKLRDTPVELIETPHRLPQTSYSLLKDNALRKKLADLGIPSWGPRSLLIHRHSEWLALWNANCDAKYPRSKQKLLKELDSWERSQGGRSIGGGSASGEGGVKGKEFESEAWGKRHGKDFRDLVRRAKEGRKQAQDPSGEGKVSEEIEQLEVVGDAPNPLDDKASFHSMTGDTVHNTISRPSSRPSSQPISNHPRTHPRPHAPSDHTQNRSDVPADTEGTLERQKPPMFTMPRSAETVNSVE